MTTPDLTSIVKSAESMPADSDIFNNEKPWGSKLPQGLERWLIKTCHTLPRSPRVFYTLNKGIRRPVKSGPLRAFDVNVLNLKLRLLNHGNYCETTALLAPQYYDVEELAWLGHYLSSGDVFMDVGGNIGLYSLVAASSVPGLNVYTIEPDPQLARRMRFNAATNQLDVHHCNTALSDYCGSGQLATDNKQSGENSLDTSEASAATNSTPNADEGSAGLAVEVTTLHALCQSLDITSIQMMKIDIEGHEHRVLSHFIDNAPTSLWPERIIIEHVHDTDEVMPLLSNKAGYKVLKTTKRNSLLSRI